MYFADVPIGIIYVVDILNDNLDLNFVEVGGDANGLILMSLNDKETPKTNVLKKALGKFTNI